MAHFTLRALYVQLTLQGGLLTGQDPSVFVATDPLKMFIIQLGKRCQSHVLDRCSCWAGVILLMSQLLGLFLRRIKQPKVIAEVLGGILLGMSCASIYLGQSDTVKGRPRSAASQASRNISSPRSRRRTSPW